MEDIITLRLKETDSTNRFLREYTGEEGSLMTVVTADYQTAGRGQGRNSWESAPGQNLLFSSVCAFPDAASGTNKGSKRRL